MVAVMPLMKRFLAALRHHAGQTAHHLEFEIVREQIAEELRIGLFERHQKLARVFLLLFEVHESSPSLSAPNDEHRAARMADHFLGGSADQCSIGAGAAMARHHD